MTAPNRTGSRRARGAGPGPSTTSSVIPPTVVRTVASRELPRTHDVLDHGLDNSDWAYVWANKQNPLDINARYVDGYRLVSYSDVEDELKLDERSRMLYTPDVNNHVAFGHELVLMRIPRTLHNERMVAAYREQTALVQDAGASEMQRYLDDFLSTAGLSSKAAPRISMDEDHGKTVAVEVVQTD